MISEHFGADGYGETSDLISTEKHLGWDLIVVPGMCWSQGYKYKLTDNSHLASSETGMIKENGSYEKRAIT